MPLEELTALLLLATAMSFSPGPNTTLSTALAANRGLPAALHFVLAVPVGWSLLLLLCAAGLGAVVMALPPLRWAIKAVGIGYLLWLALRLRRTPGMRAWAATLGALVLVQVGLGVLNVKLALPLSVAVLHNAGATALLFVLVTLLARLELPRA